MPPSIVPDGIDEPGVQGVVRSDRRTPFSRASCSNVIGMNEPAEQCQLASSRQAEVRNESMSSRSSSQAESLVR